ERIRAVADLLVARRDERQVVVVSAMAGVTDALIALVHAAAMRATPWRDAFTSLCDRHRGTAHELGADRIGDVLEAEFAALHGLLHAQSLVGAVSNDLLDLVSGLGEVWSSLLLDAHLRSRGEPSLRLDARDVLCVERGELGATVDWDSTR